MPPEEETQPEANGRKGVKAKVLQNESNKICQQKALEFKRHDLYKVYSLAIIGTLKVNVMVHRRKR